MQTFTIAEAAKLLDAQISREALKKRVQRPSAPGGLRSVLGADNKRRIPRSELERVGLRMAPIENGGGELVRALADKIADQERELVRLRALPERVESLAADKAATESRAAELEAWRSEVLQAGFWQRRRLLRLVA